MHASLKNLFKYEHYSWCFPNTTAGAFRTLKLVLSEHYSWCFPNTTASAFQTIKLIGVNTIQMADLTKVRSTQCAASQLPVEGSTDVGDAPAPAH